MAPATSQNRGPLFKTCVMHAIGDEVSGFFGGALIMNDPDRIPDRVVSSVHCGCMRAQLAGRDISGTS